MSRYNPITHYGELGAPEEQRTKGLRLSTISTHGHLGGGACIPTAAADLSKSTAFFRSEPHISAKVDHLSGGACAPRAGTQETANLSPVREVGVNLRASVDHLSGAQA
jgi:hypothetical protein